VTCGAGSHCAGGACVNDCMGVVCPTDQGCQNGQCVPVQASTGSTSGSGGSTGIGVGVGGGLPADTTASTGGAGGGGGAGGAGGQGGSGVTGSKSGCGCRVAGDPEGGALAWAGMALAIAAASRRRRGQRG
jgi:MYXO-CTERM domain-containing protein